MNRCIAYDEETGRMCGEFAYIMDRQRGGLVCAMHHNEAPTEDLAEATITLAIRTQATLIEHQLALKKIFLARGGRCLPQGSAHSHACPSANPNASAYHQVHVFGGGRW